MSTLRRGLLVGAVGAVAVLGAGTGSSAATREPNRAIAAPRVAGPAGRIKHVVVIYQENHSFDETLGWFCEQRPGRCDGYVGPVTLSQGTVVDMRLSPDIVPGVFHNTGAQTNAINGGKMDGWARVGGCVAVTHYPCLTYYTEKRIPNLTKLASKFVVSDRTFSMANSPSWGGHVYAAAATQDNFTGDIPRPAENVKPGVGWGCNSRLVTKWVDPTTHLISMQPSCIPAKPGMLDPVKFPFNGAFRPTKATYVPTIFDRLRDKHRTWKLYSSAPVWSICPSFAECVYTSQRRNVVPTRNILSDSAQDKLPDYSVVLPQGPGPGGTSQHNGESMLHGDNWMGRVLQAIENGPGWSSTAVFITYDDCGCFYDHVAPGINPDGTQQGIRVPMVIISPYAKVAYTDSHPATFASILRFTENTFGLKPLGVNDQHAYAYGNSFNFAAKPTGPRVAMTGHRLPAASLHYIATHPPDPDDPT